MHGSHVKNRDAQIEKSGSFSVAVYIFERLSLCISYSSKEEASYARVYDLTFGLDVARYELASYPGLP